MPNIKKRPTYKGKLARPMHPIPDQILFAAALIENAETEKSGSASEHPLVKKREAAFEEQRRETLERMILLFDHYGIDDYSSWFDLALALARDHVPGLGIMKARSGAKKKRSPIDDARLAVALGAVMEQRKVTKAHAARILVKQAPWSGTVKTAATLLRRVQSLDPRWLRAWEHAARFKLEKGPNEPFTLADVARANW